MYGCVHRRFAPTYMYEHTSTDQQKPAHTHTFQTCSQVFTVPEIIALPDCQTVSHIRKDWNYNCREIHNTSCQHGTIGLVNNSWTVSNLVSVKNLYSFDLSSPKYTFAPPTYTSSPTDRYSIYSARSINIEDSEPVCSCQPTLQNITKEQTLKVRMWTFTSLCKASVFLAWE